MRTWPLKVVLEWNALETEWATVIREAGDNDNTYGVTGGMTLLCETADRQIAMKVIATVQDRINAYDFTIIAWDPDGYAKILAVAFGNEAKEGLLRVETFDSSGSDDGHESYVNDEVDGSDDSLWVRDPHSEW